jgi:hypothetical protein
MEGGAFIKKMTSGWFTTVNVDDALDQQFFQALLMQRIFTCGAEFRTQRMGVLT